MAEAAAPAHPAISKLDVAFDDVASVRSACSAFRDLFDDLRKELGKAIVGQDEIVEQTLIALFANGHTLLEGVPGLGKTLLVSTLSKTLNLPFSRIQFTPDVMPADISGTSVVIEDPATGHRDFQFRPGPIFNQLILADEINRATPKSQSALLEAMQERSVTIAGQTHQLVEPFFVMATQNPIEQEGTYPLPEAQLDRFLFKIVVPYTTRDEMQEILERTTREGAPDISRIIDNEGIRKAQRLAERIIVAPHVQDFIIRLSLATNPSYMQDGEALLDEQTRRYIAIGVSPRGAQSLTRAAKVKALIDGRCAVSYHDVDWIARPALRHRLARSFEAEADNMTTDDIIDRLLEVVERYEPDSTEAVQL